jgi:outer membrane lipoprotein-sorting protein
MIRSSSLLAALVLGPLAAGAVLVPPAAVAADALRVLTGAERDAAIARANAALNALRQVEGRFVQVADDGAAAKGEFQLQRPGKVRFAYAPPTPLVLASDGVSLSQLDTQRGSVESTALRATPLYYVLKQNIDLAADGAITQVARDGEQLLVTLRDRKGEMDGSVTLVFAGAAAEPELRGWRIQDGAGETTTVTLQDVRPAQRFDPRLFSLRPKTDSTDRGGGR